KAVKPAPGSSITHLESKWKNKDGQELSISKLVVRPQLVAMMFTRCETACPLIVEDLKAVVNQLASSQQKQITVSIFSIDPKETVDDLKNFAVKRKLPVTWNVYASNENAIAEMAAALGVRYKLMSNGDYIHSNIIYFLDAN